MLLVQLFQISAGQSRNPPHFLSIWAESGRLEFTDHSVVGCKLSRMPTLVQVIALAACVSGYVATFDEEQWREILTINFFATGRTRSGRSIVLSNLLARVH